METAYASDCDLRPNHFMYCLKIWHGRISLNLPGTSHFMPHGPVMVPNLLKALNDNLDVYNKASVELYLILHNDTSRHFYFLLYYRITSLPYTEPSWSFACVP